MITGKTLVQVYESDKQKELLYTGYFQGYGIISLGMNGQETGILVLSQTETNEFLITCERLKNVKIYKSSYK